MSVTTWFVTGASRGFGRELTGQLLARGHRVAATLRRPEQLDDLAGRHQDRLWVRALDVTDTGQMRRVVAEAFADLGRVDVVVSNAGFGVFGAAEARLTGAPRQTGRRSRSSRCPATRPRSSPR
jgi:NAD(P)-dependent dehydrogenase (short-subunit alcohol dehydrogenase family)